jgi:hypothetical protein
MRSFLSLLAATTIASAALAAPSPAIQQRNEQRLAMALAGMTAGPPVNCINFHDIRETEIIDRTAIIYRVSNTRLYLNRPDVGADSLSGNDTLVTKSSLTQLCNVDTVQLLDRTTHFQHGFVGLGQFVPYTKAAPRN